MALEPIIVDVDLDVYDHDLTPTSIKTIALDSRTRFVRARLTKEGEDYQPDSNASVKLIALRPDKVGVEGSGEFIELTSNSESETPVEAEGPDEIIVAADQEENQNEGVSSPSSSSSSVPVYGLQAELTQDMLAISGTVYFQFKMILDEEILRTEVFRANNGRALDAEAALWIN